MAESNEGNNTETDKFKLTLNGDLIVEGTVTSQNEESGVGKSLAGENVKPTYNSNIIIAGEGAEIFNDYRDRTYSGTAPMTGCVSSGKYSHAEGFVTTASGNYSHSEGAATFATANSSHAEGSNARAVGENTHAEGSATVASGMYSHAEGNSTNASGDVSHAEGYSTASSGQYSHAEGYITTASNFASHVNGKFNKAMTNGGSMTNTTGDAMVIGNGSSRSALSNCFRVTFAGATYGIGSFHTTGADYAEFFEWLDGNNGHEDRVGHFVTMEGSYIRYAEPGDYILGIVSGQPAIVGNSDEDWLGRWQHDEFGRFVKEYLETSYEEIDTSEMTEEEIHELETEEDVELRDDIYYRRTEHIVGHETPSWRHKANPDYDPNAPYIERKDRPEWDYIGMMGVLSVYDNGQCQVNGFCQCGDGGIAVPADIWQPGLTYRVIERVTDDIIRVVLK